MRFDCKLIIEPSIEFSESDMVEEKEFLIITHEVSWFDSVTYQICLNKERGEIC